MKTIRSFHSFLSNRFPVTLSALVFGFALFPDFSSAQVTTPPDGSPHDYPQKPTAANGCKNNQFGPQRSCGPCEEKVPTITSYGGFTCILTAGGESMWSAKDYENPSSDGGCGPCGSSSTGDSSLPMVTLKRTNRSRYDYSSLSSFGIREYWGAYDNNLRFYNSESDQIRVFDHVAHDMVIRSWFDASRGCWVNHGDEHFVGLYLYKADGSQVLSLADRKIATHAVRLMHDGTTEHYEIFWNMNQTGFGRLTEIMDRNLNSVKITYEHAIPFGTLVSDTWKYTRRTKIVDPHGREFIPTYQRINTRDVITKITLPNGEEVNYSYGTLGSYTISPSLVSVTLPDGSSSQYSSVNDDQRLLTATTIKEVAANGMSKKNTYYHSRNIGYDAQGNTVSTTRRILREVRNGAGEVVYANRFQETDNTVFVYHGGNAVERLQLDASFGAAQVNRIQNEVWKQGFHSTNTSQWVGDTQQLASHDARQRSLTESDPFGRVESFTRSPLSGEILGTTFPDATTSAQTRNHFQQVLTETDRLGRKATHTYDLMGNLIVSVSAEGTADESTTSYIYNSRGQVTEVRHPLYDADQPDLHNTRYEYNAQHYLVKKIEAADQQGDARPETLFSYDAAGNLLTTTDPTGRQTSFTYDARNRRVRTTYNDASYEETTYGTGEEAHLVVSRRDRNGGMTTYAYDAAGRLIKTTEAAGSPEQVETTLTYLYGTSNILTETRHGETTTYLYDFANRRIGHTVKAHVSSTLTSISEFDQTDRLRSSTDPYGRKTFYLYDQNNRLTRTVTETVPAALDAIAHSQNPDDDSVPAITPDAQQSASPHNFTFTDKNANTLETDPQLEGRTHQVTYTCARDLFLAGLTRDLSNNAPYLITDTIYDAEGQQLVSTDARGVVTWSEYDTLGRNTLTIIAVGTPEEIRSETDFDKASNVTEQRRPRYFSENIAARETFTYTGRNLQASHTVYNQLPAGEMNAENVTSVTESWTYYPDGREAMHTDFRGNVSQKFYHACCGRLQADVARDGDSMTIYNTDYLGQPTHSATVRLNTQTPNNYQWHDPVDGDTLRESTTRFDLRGRPTHTTAWLSPRGYVDDDTRQSLGDPNEMIIAENQPTVGLTTAYVYDDDLTDGSGLDAKYAAQLATLAGHGVSFGLGANGSAVEVTNPAGESSCTVQDGAGRTVMEINAEGHAAFMLYDVTEPLAVLRGTASEAPAFDEIASEWDAASVVLLKTTSIDALGNASHRFTDAAGRTLVAEDAAGAFSFMAYDAAGNLTLQRDPINLGHSCAYDALGRRSICADRQEQAEGKTRSFFYDADSNLVKSITADAAESTASFDARGRLITSTDANLIETTYTYDDNNNLLSLTDGEGHTRQWTYDTRNLQVSKSYPADANDVLTYVYDALGRLVVKTQQDGSTIEHVYDLAGRMTSRVYKNAGTTESTDSFTYDAASRLTATTKGRYGISTEHTYAPDGMPLSEKLIADSRTYTSTRTYDAANRPLNHTFPDGKSTAWTWDERHLVTGVTYEGENILSNLHDSGYRLRVQSFGNGLSRHLDYARQDHLRTQDRVNQGGQQVDALSHSYSYAADKQITAETVAGGVMQNASFQASYDAGNRLASWTRPGQIAATSPLNQTWNYDDAGNWSSTTQKSNVQNRTHNASDQLTNIDGTATQLDPRGNLTEFTSNNKDYQLEYDFDNRLKTADVDNNDAEYRYDAFGRRVIRQQGTNKIAYIWWGDQETAEHQHGAGQATIQNDLWAHPNDLNTVVARAVEGSKYDLQWYHKNYLDHIYAVSDDTGDILEHYRYTAFGEVEIYDPTGLPQTETQINNPLTWNSRRTDPLTGFHYYKYRHYAPALGRWLSRDPIEEEGGVNLYAFVGNDPLMYWDYLGLAAETIWDAANVGMGLGNLGYNLWNGNWSDAAWDAGGLLVDGAATCIPIIPGGCATANNARRGVNAIDKANDARKAAEAAKKAAREARKRAQKEAKERAKQEAKDRIAYGAICKTPMPAHITDPCHIAKFNLWRARACLAARQKFRKKWKKGDMNHDLEIHNARKAVRNAEDEVKKKCGKTIHDSINDKEPCE